MEPIEELKELVRQNMALTQETNAMVKSMHRASVWGRVFKFIWIGLIVASLIGTFVFLGPYLEQMRALYDSIQEALQEARNIGSQFQQGGGQ